MMGEFQISNLPIILIAIAIICMGVLGYFEIKKLYLKLSEIDAKLDEITESLTKRQIPQQMPSGQQIPPHILEQRRMMMLRQQQQQQHQQQMSQQAQMKNQEQDEELNNENISNEIDEDQEQDNDDYGEELSSESSSRSSSRSSQDNDDDEIISKDNDDIISKDEEDDNISHTTEMTIELDNEFKHLSVKELKELCQDNNLQISGNKSKLISRLLENKNN